MDAQLQRIAALLSRVGHAGGEHHHRLRSVAAALLVAALSVVGLAIQGRLRHPDVIVFCACLCAPLAMRRRDEPFSAFLAIAAVSFVQWLVSTPQLADAAVLVALYWVALESGGAQLAAAAVITEAGAVMAAWRWNPTEPLKVWVGLTGLAVAAGGLGVTVRQRRALVASLHDRAARLELERDQQGRLAAAAERARIAREMHDIVSHNLTVMIALADGAAYVMESEPERALPAIERVSATGRQALVEMRRLLGVLRDRPEEHPLAPQPTLERLDELLARVDAAGVPVSLEVHGEPGRLAEGVQLAIFRVAQEALTNTLKHASRPATAHVALRCDDREVELEVADTGRPLAAIAAGSSSEGRGLRGMRERAAAYGGVLEAGPADGGGWRVRLCLRPDGGPA